MISQDLAFEEVRAAAAGLVDELNRCLAPGAAEMPSLRHWETRDAEGDFVRVVSWLHAFFRESAADSVAFLDRYLVDADGEMHRRDVVLLRTYFQHHLSQSSSDADKRDRAEVWIAERGGGLGGAVAWRGAYQAVLGEAVRLVRVLQELLRDIDPDLRAAMPADWNTFIDRQVDAVRTDPVIRRLASEIGLDDLDVAAFRRRHISIWQNEMRNIVFRTDPDLYLDSLISRDLVRLLSNAPMPLSGVDVMEAFGLPPGREVGSLLSLARGFWESTPSPKPGRDAILEHVATTTGRSVVAGRPEA